MVSYQDTSYLSGILLTEQICHELLWPIVPRYIIGHAACVNAHGDGVALDGGAFSHWVSKMLVANLKIGRSNSCSS
ncbi:hypothetical protein L6164_030297 [Bauhinia variegata]|uniref:Uncharacterized protein n=1 Tax=Bauhinia variegata TaxID=167791 RepID=A0ACB9LBP4_BAUVA|nr:hypothetical protein L6164_030297 [Bauhinia variegata]